MQEAYTKYITVSLVRVCTHAWSVTCMILCIFDTSYKFSCEAHRACCTRMLSIEDTFNDGG